MQFEGGYRYPAGTIWGVLSVVGVVAVLLVCAINKVPVWRALGALLTVEGTVLWASSFTPKGLSPPPPRFWLRVTWFFKQESGVTFSLNQPMFYSGILLVIAGTILSSCAG